MNIPLPASTDRGDPQLSPSGGQNQGWVLPTTPWRLRHQDLGLRGHQERPAVQDLPDGPLGQREERRDTTDPADVSAASAAPAAATAAESSSTPAADSRPRSSSPRHAGTKHSWSRSPSQHSTRGELVSSTTSDESRGFRSRPLCCRPVFRSGRNPEPRHYGPLVEPIHQQSVCSCSCHQPTPRNKQPLLELLEFLSMVLNGSSSYNILNFGGFVF